MSEPRWIEALNTVRGTRIAFAIVAVVSAVLFFGNLGRIGIWEPWEANEIFVANEYLDRGEPTPSSDPTASSWNWAVPTYEGKTVARPLLKTWLIGLGGDTSGELSVGSLELKARGAIAVLVWAFVLIGFWWTRRRFGTAAALLSGLAFSSFPVVFMGVHNLATEMVFVVTTSLALIAWFELQYTDTKKWLWAAALGVALALSFLDQRLVGLYLVLIIMAAHAATEVAFESSHRKEPLIGKPELGACAAAIVAVLGVLAVGYFVSKGADGSAMFKPHVLQWFGVLIPLLLAAAGFALARKTKAVQTLLSPPMALAFGIPIITLSVVAFAYGSANPTLLKNGEIFGQIPVLRYLLENHIFGNSLAVKHMTFDLWVRQIGFAIVTWVGVAPLAVGYLARASRKTADDKNPTEPSIVARRFLLVWMVFAALVMMGAAAFNHYFYPAYFPIAVGIGVMLVDTKFWKEMRKEPLVLLAMGFTAITIVMMVGKDLERFPARFVEVYTVMQEKLDLKDDFSFGKIMKVLKYGLMLLLMVHFFGLVSWVGLTWQRRSDILSALRHPLTRFKGWIAGSARVSPSEDRAADKEAYRAEAGWLSKVAQFVETPTGFPILLVVACLIATATYIVEFIPEITNHMSQRGVFETYVKSAEKDQKLWSYDVASRDVSVYLKDVKKVGSATDFRKMFESPERAYAVIPRDNLARINYEIRKDTHKNLAVLDARSSRLLLVSNQLDLDEKDYNYVAESIIEDPSVIQNQLLFDLKGEKVHPTFDDQLEMVGYSFNHKPDSDGYVSYKWGETAVIDYFFKVKKRVPGNQKIFLHADTPGNRISGDHYPNDGDFPTNYWLEGDIVRSRQNLKIEDYSSPGIYTLNFGFYIGSKRMAVQPRAAHDGGNRVPVAKIRVKSL